MRLISLSFTLVAFLLGSCTSLKVFSDYESGIDFTKYKTFAFYKKGIDKAAISDIDKKRIMRAVENELVAKGLNKSKSPDLLVSIFTKSRDQISVTNNNPGWGWGWAFSPWMYRGTNVIVSQHTEGILFIDFFDKNENKLVWQGIGTGVLKMRSVEKKEAQINEFVNKIIASYPPNSVKK